MRKQEKTFHVIWLNKFLLWVINTRKNRVVKYDNLHVFFIKKYIDLKYFCCGYWTYIDIKLFISKRKSISKHQKNIFPESDIFWALIYLPVFIIHIFYISKIFLSCSKRAKVSKTGIIFMSYLIAILIVNILPLVRGRRMLNRTAGWRKLLLLQVTSRWGTIPYRERLVCRALP